MVAGGRGRRHRRQSTGRMPSWRRRSGRELGLRLIRFRLDFPAGGLQHLKENLPRAPCAAGTNLLSLP